MQHEFELFVPNGIVSSNGISVHAKKKKQFIYFETITRKQRLVFSGKGTIGPLVLECWNPFSAAAYFDLNENNKFVLIWWLHTSLSR